MYKIKNKQLLHCVQKSKNKYNLGGIRLFKKNNKCKQMLIFIVYQTRVILWNNCIEDKTCTTETPI